MVMLAVDAFFSLDAIAEAAEAAKAAQTASTAAAATTAAETAAAQQAAAAAAAQQAATAAGSGIMSAAPTAAVVGPESAMAAQAAQGGMGAASGIPPVGIEQATAAMQQGALQPPPAGLEELAVKGTLPPPPPTPNPFFDPSTGASGYPPNGPPPPANVITTPQVSTLNLPSTQPFPYQAGLENVPGAPVASPSAAPPPVASPPPGITSAPTDLRTTGWRANVPVSSNPFLNQTVDPALVNQPSLSSQLLGQTTTAPLAEPTSAFERGLDKAMAWADKNPLKAAGIAYTGASMLGLTRPNYGNFNSTPYDGPLSKYKLSPNYKATIANPSQYQYAPRYAEGGIMQMAEGGITGSGNLTLNVPIDFGGGQNDTQSTPNYAFGNVNSGANTGFFGQNSTQVSAPSNPQGSVNAQQPSILNQQAGTPDLMQSLQQLKPEEKAAPINVGGPADVSPDQNQPQKFATGGSTGNLSSSLDYYTKMMEGETPKMPSSHPTDAGIYHDSDPDTRSLDPYSAARVRLAKTNKRAYVAAPSFPAPTPMGQLNLSPPGAKADGTQYLEAAKGGIMGLSDLGGYAAGGNPRLLKGPGDGMSDNIPATINGRQPARLADGEFVIPADVVSHLGNGSTDAGAKVLHQMMTKVRQERTGNPHQGKQINPRKYMPR